MRLEVFVVQVRHNGAQRCPCNQIAYTNVKPCPLKNFPFGDYLVFK